MKRGGWVDRGAYRRDPQAYLRDRVQVVGECWEWQLATDKGGYGRLRVRCPSGVTHVFAHRASYATFVGPIPEGLHIDHLCRNRRCINPAHLEAVTGAENIRRGSRGAPTHCKYGHEFTEANTRIQHYRGYVFRACKTCQGARSRNHLPPTSSEKGKPS